MAFCDHETFQAHCRWCQVRFQADSIEEAIQKAEEHEAECPKRKAKP